MRKLLRNMCTMLMASVLLVTGSCGGTTWVSGVENTNTLIEKLTNMEEIQDPEKYTQIYLDENYLGPVPDMWEFKNLKNIEVSEKNTKYKIVEGALLSKDGSKLYAFPPQKECKIYAVPKTVKVICADAFYRSKIEKVTITDNLRKIGESAFTACNNLTSIDLMNVKTVERWAFGSCTNLTQLNLGKVKNIGERAFWGIGVKNITLNKKYNLGVAAFDTKIKINYGKKFKDIKPYLLSYKRWNEVKGAKGYEVVVRVYNLDNVKDKVYLKTTVKKPKLSKKFRKKIARMNERLNGEISSLGVKIRAYRYKNKKKVYTKWSDVRKRTIYLG